MIRFIQANLRRMGTARGLLEQAARETRTDVLIIIGQRTPPLRISVSFDPDMPVTPTKKSLAAMLTANAASGVSSPPVTPEVTGKKRKASSPLADQGSPESKEVDDAFREMVASVNAIKEVASHNGSPKKHFSGQKSSS